VCAALSSLYEDRDGTLFATEYCRGPWSPDAQHGGAPAALLMRAFENCEPDPALATARVTYELLKPVPLGPLSVSVSVVRPGKRVQLLEGSIYTPDGTEVVRARALRVARAGVESGAVQVPPATWRSAEPMEFGDFARGLTIFPGDGMEIRFVKGGFFELGAATAWFRLKLPVFGDETPSPLQRLAAASDFPNGIATELPWTEYLFINPDLTIYVEREPIGEWVCLDANMRVEPSGVGLSQAVLYDEQGRVGRSLQSLYVAPR